MPYQLTKERKIAFTLLLIISINTFLPSIAYALTSGPTQPETKGFQPAGVSDMVDLQTGDFKYNIPLLDIDGYPINLNYKSGVGMDDEASWVGAGWNLNVGAINRQLRGIPDDMAGDTVTTEHYTKPKVTVGGTASVKGEFFGDGLLNGSLSLGIFNDNYTGIGAEIGANAGVSFSLGNDGALTAGLGAGITSSTQSGVDASPYVNLGYKANVDNNMTVSAGLSATLGYNTRSGLKSFTLGSSYGVSGHKEVLDVQYIGVGGITVDSKSGSANYSGAGSSISYNTEPITPKISVPYQTHYGSFSLYGGGALWGAYLGAGLAGYKSVREVMTLRNINQAYGFLYAERGKNTKTAVMDFIREKENPIIPDIPNLALPIQTPDLFTYTSQSGGGEFRLYRGGTGAFFDNEVSDASNVTTAGIEAGFGAYFHGGLELFKQSTSNTTRKWTTDNAYLPKGDFQDTSTSHPAAEQVYFKQVGEKNIDDPAVTSLLYQTKPLAINITYNQQALGTFRDSTPYFNSSLPEGNMVRNARQPKRTVISYLTAKDASHFALDANILSYPVNDAATFAPPTTYTAPVPDSTLSRLSGKRRPHHISEITVTDDGGKRMVYGIPVYNLKQDEYSFAVGVAGTDYDVVNQNQVVQHAGATGPWYTNTANLPGAGLGIDNYYHKDSQPAYASSFLLTAILSPDYVDKTGNGISDDDLGTAIKFNYSKQHAVYKWRTPYQNATLNRCLLADADDDKASIVYGEKEIWYLHSIESKTKIVYFITKERRDGLGVLGWTGGQDTTNKQRCLTEIRLYSKADMSRPIKTVKFEYNYQLCPGVPNSLAGGKLTLTKVYFEYGNSPKGQNHPYTFYYNQTINNSTISYSNMSTDRWGLYKSPNTGQNAPFQLNNEEFPYTIQNKAAADSASALFHLKQINLPTGGQINVSYESGDYAYVQDKKAMVMSPVQCLVDINGAAVDSNYLERAKGIRVGISTSPPTGADPTAWFERNYLSGSNYIYTKLYIKVSTGLSNSKGQDWDFVPCYAQVSKVIISGSTANVIFTDRTEVDTFRGNVTDNPISMTAWQKMKEEYPRYAYPGFDNREDVNNAAQSVESAVDALVSAFGNLGELRKNFYQKAQQRNYAGQVFLKKSFVRLIQVNGFKYGGGTRVKKIQITDNWQTMSGTGTAPIGVYGQSYDYTTVEDGQTISSGVAAYEPSVGNDENPLKQPVPYTERNPGGLDNFYDLETPFGESFYPGPTVGYSMVTVRDLDQSGVPDPTQRTGYTVSEFYTAKDFPVQVHVLPIQNYENKPTTTYGLFETNSMDELCLSQGYSIDLNDMHGKPKANRVFNQSGSEISSTVYYYNTKPLGSGELALNNVVDVVKSNGQIDSQRTIGRDIEFYTDFREQETINDGHTYNAGVDVIPIFGFPAPFPHAPVKSNYDYKRFRSACAVKVNQYYGIIDSVVKKLNGSQITTQNLAYDGLTGEPVVTRTQNEFKNNIYSVSLPAYWVYNGMGAAYQNIGMLFSGFSTNANGEVNNYSSYLQGGDEICDVNTGAHYWVINNAAFSGSGNTMKLIDRNGNIIPNKASSLVKIIRSGYHNLLNASTGSLTSLNNPISGGHLQFISNADLTSLKVINASASTYDESWATNLTSYRQLQQNSPYYLFTSGTVQPSPTGYTTYYFNDSDTFPYTTISCPYFSTRSFFTNVSIHPNVSVTPVTSETMIGLDTCFNVARSDYYYIGLGDGDLSGTRADFSLDNQAIYDVGSSSSLVWNIKATRVYLSAGIHHFTCQRLILASGSQQDWLGFEIYDNSLAELESADAYGSGIKKIFTTAGIYSNPFLKTVYTSAYGGPLYYRYTWTGTGPYYDCGDPYLVVGVTLNPYIQGYLGNWRLYQTNTYLQNRAYNDVFNTANNGMDIANAGYINKFLFYWYYGTASTGQPGWVVNTSATSWVNTNTVTLYDKYGQQLENRDALGRYSAANFGFNGELPSAVASNAMNREIYASTFEDAKFTFGLDNSINYHDFVNPANGASIQSLANSALSHSGNYGVLLPSGGVNMTTIVNTTQQKTSPYLTLDNFKQYTTQSATGIYPNGFEPTPGKNYIFDVWVNDSQPNTPSVNVSLNVNSVNVPLKCKAIVEDWKLVEGVIHIPSLANGTALNIALVPSSSTIYIDDIRMHPFDSQMKTYAYDDKTLRLMAELDENAFATFYEYDDEGLLVRVKKETERGIMTLKESRSSYKKTP